MIMLHTRALFALCTLSVLIWSSLFSALLSLAASVLLLFLSLFSVLLTVSAFFLLSSKFGASVFVWFLFAFVLPLPSSGRFGAQTAGGHLSAVDLCFSFLRMASD